MPRGWQGDPPRTDEQARERIIDAAMRCIDRDQTLARGLSDVAAELGVTRQTIYRHFPSTEDLLIAVAQVSAANYLDRLGAHLADTCQPEVAVVDAIVFAAERLPRERFLGSLLLAGRSATFLKGVTSQDAIRLSRSMLHRMNVDWDDLGFTEADLDGLAELGLRLIQSLVLDPGPWRSRAQLRQWLTEWVAPSIEAKVSRCASQRP